MQVRATIGGNERPEYNERTSEYSATGLSFCVDSYNRGKARKGLGVCRIVRGIEITQLTLEENLRVKDNVYVKGGQ